MASATPASRWLPGLVSSRSGRFSPLKACTLALLFLPALWLADRYLTDRLGARPVLALVHGTGLWTLRLLLITLVLSPAKSLLGWNGLNQIRRMVGVSAACYAVLHLMLFAAQQNWRIAHVAGEILHRVYLTVGFIVLLIVLAMASTSTDQAVRRLGRNWKRLHRLSYLGVALGLLHYFMQAKAEIYNAAIAAGLYLWLIGWRFAPINWRSHPALPLLLFPFAVAGAALVEFSWYGIATRVHAYRVLMANFQLQHWRPSVWVAFWAIGAIGLVLIRLAWRRGFAGRTPDQIVPSIR